VIRGEEYKGSIVKTALCELLGIEYPIIAAPMGPDLAGPELVAAVSNAGGLGILQAQLAPPPLFRREIQRIRELTDKPFGVNLILHFPADDQVAICVEERVPVLSKLADTSLAKFRLLRWCLAPLMPWRRGLLQRRVGSLTVAES